MTEGGGGDQKERSLVCPHTLSSRTALDEHFMVPLNPRTKDQATPLVAEAANTCLEGRAPRSPSALKAPDRALPKKKKKASKERFLQTFLLVQRDNELTKESDIKTEIE